MQKTTIALLVLFSSGALADGFEEKIVEAALVRTKVSIRYDGGYLRIPYPNGDVPSDTGVCTDVIIRIYRALGIDLQKLVHEDMKANFDAYPFETNLGVVEDGQKH